MSDLDTMTAIRPDVALPTSSDLMAARRQLDEAIMTEVDETRTGTGVDYAAPVPFVAPRRRKRAVRVAVAAVAASAAAAAGVFALTGSSSPGRPSGGVPVLQLTAARFLHAAATAVRLQPANPPLPGQFVYSETENPDGSLSRTWLSADGSQPGLNEWSGEHPGPNGTSGSNAQPACSTAQAESTGCAANAGYFPDMPTDPKLMLGYLNSVHVVDTTGNANDALPGWEDNVLGKAVSELMQSSYLLPAQQAALFQLMAQTPGFQIVSNMQDAIGRTGVGIEWTFEAGTGVVIFDSSTYAYLGTRTWKRVSLPTRPLPTMAMRS